MTCGYCDGWKVVKITGEYQNTDKTSLLEIFVDKGDFTKTGNPQLEIHFFGLHEGFDYEEGQVEINFCPFCGKKLVRKEIEV